MRRFAKLLCFYALLAVLMIVGLWASQQAEPTYQQMNEQDCAAVGGCGH